PRSDVPETDCVDPCRGERATVRAERDVGRSGSRAGERQTKRAAARDVPEDSADSGAGRKELAVGAERQVVDARRPLDLGEPARAGDVPQLDSPGGVPGGEQLPGSECDGV